MIINNYTKGRVQRGTLYWLKGNLKMAIHNQYLHLSKPNKIKNGYMSKVTNMSASEVPVPGKKVTHSGIKH